MSAVAWQLARFCPRFRAWASSARMAILGVRTLTASGRRVPGEARRQMNSGSAAMFLVRPSPGRKLGCCAFGSLWHSRAGRRRAPHLRVNTPWAIEQQLPRRGFRRRFFVLTKACEGNPEASAVAARADIASALGCRTGTDTGREGCPRRLQEGNRGSQSAAASRLFQHPL